MAWFAREDAVRLGAKGEKAIETLSPNLQPTLVVRNADLNMES